MASGEDAVVGSRKPSRGSPPPRKTVAPLYDDFQQVTDD